MFTIVVSLSFSFGLAFAKTNKLFNQYRVIFIYVRLNFLTLSLFNYIFTGHHIVLEMKVSALASSIAGLPSTCLSHLTYLVLGIKARFMEQHQVSCFVLFNL